MCVRERENEKRKKPISSLMVGRSVGVKASRQCNALFLLLLPLSFAFLVLSSFLCNQRWFGRKEGKREEWPPLFFCLVSTALLLLPFFVAICHFRPQKKEKERGKNEASRSNSLAPLCSIGAPRKIQKSGEKK